jgi:hypothetical protein
MHSHGRPIKIDCAVVGRVWAEYRWILDQADAHPARILEMRSEEMNPRTRAIPELQVYFSESCRPNSPGSPSKRTSRLTGCGRSDRLAKRGLAALITRLWHHRGISSERKSGALLQILPATCFEKFWTVLGLPLCRLLRSTSSAICTTCSSALRVNFLGLRTPEIVARLRSPTNSKSLHALQPGRGGGKDDVGMLKRNRQFSWANSFGNSHAPGADASDKRTSDRGDKICLRCWNCKHKPAQGNYCLRRTWELPVSAQGACPRARGL